MIVASSPDPSGPEFEFPSGAVIRYDASGTATVTSDKAVGTISVGAYISQKKPDDVIFVKGGSYILSSETKLRTVGPNTSVDQLKPAVEGKTAVSTELARTLVRSR